jgi:hypothetical protein
MAGPGRKRNKPKRLHVFEGLAMTIYNGAALLNPGEFPGILALGDSWFWYPKKNNLLDALARHPRLNRDYQHMVRLGANGALLSQYVDLPDGRLGKYSAILKHHLSPQFMSASVVLISGAGNDAINYRLGLKPDCSAAGSVEDCFNLAGAKELLKQLSQALGLLLTEILWSYHQQNRKLSVFLHTYDYPVPDGRGFSLFDAPVSHGPWLKKAMDDCLVPDDMALRKDVCVRLINVFADTLAGFDSPADRIYHIDSRGTLSRGADYQADWDNELHPTAAGFDRIIDRCWVPVLARHGVCN